MRILQIFDRRICRFLIPPDAFFLSKIASWKHPPTDLASDWLTDCKMVRSPPKGFHLAEPFWDASHNPSNPNHHDQWGRCNSSRFLWSCDAAAGASTGTSRITIINHQVSTAITNGWSKKQLQTETVNCNPIQNGHFTSFSRRHLSYLHFVLCIVCLWCLWWFHLMFRWMQPTG